MQNYYVCGILLLFFFSLSVAPVPAVTSVIPAGGTAFIGEEGLNIKDAVPDPYHQIAWFSPGSDIQTSQPGQILTIPEKDTFYVAPVDFTDRTGIWYLWDGKPGNAAFYVREAMAEVRVYDNSISNDVTGGTLERGHLGNFRIDSNLWQATSRPGYNPATDGLLSIKFKTPQGSLLSSLAVPGGEKSLSDLDPGSSPWYWAEKTSVTGWDTAAGDANKYYPAGIYQVQTEITLNHIKDNIPSGFTQPVTVSLTMAILSLTSNTEKITRGQPFTVILSGAPKSTCYLWVKGTSSMSGERGDQPPMMVISQEGVSHDSPPGPYRIGSYEINGKPGYTLRSDVPSFPEEGTRYYAEVTTDASGTRVVQFSTSSGTRAQSYTISVEQKSGSQYLSDTLSVPLAPGKITISSTDSISDSSLVVTDTQEKKPQTTLTSASVRGDTLQTNNPLEEVHTEEAPVYAEQTQVMEELKPEDADVIGDTEPVLSEYSDYEADTEVKLAQYVLEERTHEDFFTLIILPIIIIIVISALFYHIRHQRLNKEENSGATTGNRDQKE